MEPRFSIVIPTYNRAKTLGRAIESVLGQTFPAFEIIVVDDGSSDRTKDVVESFTQIRYVFQSNSGVSSARNKGAELADGDWLVFLDSDDEILPNALEKFTNVATALPQASILLGGYSLIKNGVETFVLPEEGKYIGHLSGSFAIKKVDFIESAGYDSNLRFAENTELFFRIEKLRLTQGLVPFPIMKYYQQNEGGNSNLKEMTAAILYILEKHPKLPDSIKRLYNQIVGVNYLRFRQFPEARKHLFEAYSLNPTKLDTLGRWVIALLPALAKRLYTPTPNLK